MTRAARSVLNEIRLRAASALAMTRSLRFGAAPAGWSNRLSDVGVSVRSAEQQALARVYDMLMAQAQTISYVEVYWFLTLASVVMSLFSFLLARNNPGGGGELLNLDVTV
jgi:hypothetical protein